MEELKHSGKNWIYSLWHNNITLAAVLLKNQNLLAMVSASEDGKMAARVIELFGNRTIYGSSSRGGAKVLLAMIKGIKAGRIGAITPDGPRGPKYVLQSGVISVAQKTSTPLVPIHIEATRQWIFTKSWDNHKFPKPFSIIVISIGPPYFVPEKLEKEEFDSVQEGFQSQMITNAKHTEDTVSLLRKRK